MAQSLHSQYIEQAKKHFQTIMQLQGRRREKSPEFSVAVKQFVRAIYLANCYIDSPDNRVTRTGITYPVREKFPKLVEHIYFENNMLHITLLPIQEVHTDSSFATLFLATKMPVMPRSAGDDMHLTYDNVSASLEFCYKYYPNLRRALVYNEQYVRINSQFISCHENCYTPQNYYNLSGWKLGIEIPVAALCQHPDGVLRKSDVDVLIRWIQGNFTNSKGSESYMPTYAPDSDKVDFFTLQQYATYTVNQNGITTYYPTIQSYTVPVSRLRDGWDNVMAKNCDWQKLLPFIGIPLPAQKVMR